jgi:hypothetical protein
VPGDVKTPSKQAGAMTYYLPGQVSQQIPFHQSTQNT